MGFSGVYYTGRDPHHLNEYFYHDSFPVWWMRQPSSRHRLLPPCALHAPVSPIADLGQPSRHPSKHCL
mgnify:CR=1 FL=1